MLKLCQKTGVFLVLLWTLTAASYAQSDLRTFTCTYSEYVDPKGKHETNTRLTFVWDVSSNKSYMLGDQGQTRVSTLSARLKVSFLEITSTGEVIATTINLNPESDYESVHSRNTSVENIRRKILKLTPSQYYGKCTLTGYNPLVEE